MKKHYCWLLLTAVCIIGSCKSDQFSKVSSGFKTISSCCKKITSFGKAASSIETRQEEPTGDIDNNGSFLLPANTWDSKRMIW